MACFKDCFKCGDYAELMEDTPSAGKPALLDPHGANSGSNEINASDLANRQMAHRKPNALAEWSVLSEDLQTSTIAVFLDYDGTLTPIVDDPDDAQISTEMTEVLRDLASRVSVAIVTGRGNDPIHKFIQIPNLYYATSHGHDIRDPFSNEIKRVGDEYLPHLKAFEHRISSRLRHIAGLAVEDNVFSISVHYRHVDQKDMLELENAIDEELSNSELPLIKRNGKKVFEARPGIDWHKGRAVETLLTHMFPDGHENTLVIYLGDDVSDEDVFKLLRERRKGLGIWVKGVRSDVRHTEACHMLENVGEVQEFLTRLTQIRKEKE